MKTLEQSLKLSQLMIISKLWAKNTLVWLQINYKWFPFRVIKYFPRLVASEKVQGCCWIPILAKKNIIIFYQASNSWVNIAPCISFLIFSDHFIVKTDCYISWLHGIRWIEWTEKSKTIPDVKKYQCASDSKHIPQAYVLPIKLLTRCRDSVATEIRAPSGTCGAA